MNIIVKKPLKTLLDEKAPQYEATIVFPGKYKLILVQLGKEEMFFFLDDELQGVGISKVVLYALERIGFIEIIRDENFSDLTTNFPPENTINVANMTGRLGGRPYF